MLTGMRGSEHASGASLSHDPLQELGEMLLCIHPYFSSALVFRGPKPSVRAFRGIHSP